MAEGGLLLGPILFQDFELPERVSWGGAQRLAVHRLPGGGRVLDAMGREDADIVWEGVFSGVDAATRARAVDLMRAEGGWWPLTWDWFYYTVVISRFDAEYAKQNWIPYRIACSVVYDETEAIASAALSLAASLANDLATAAACGTGVSLASATAACGAAGATQPGSNAYNAAVTELAGARLGVDAGMASTETGLAGTTIGGPQDLLAVTDLAGQLASLSAARGFVSRAGINLDNAAT
jgi:hypothetical protein